MAERLEPSAPMIRPFLEIRPLLRALSIASDARQLVLASLGLVTLWAGWSLLAWGFGPPSPWLLPIPFGFDLDSATSPPQDHFFFIPSLIGEPYRVVIGPTASLFFKGTALVRWFQTLLMSVWAIAVWGVLGGAIARVAVVQAAGDHRVGMLSALKFALRKASSLIGAPLTPLFAVALFAMGCRVFGLVFEIPMGVGSTIAAILGFVPLLFGLVMSLILLGLAFGWPLMVATIAAEGEDAPDALSRSYSYVNQRLPRYAIHVLFIGLIGLIGLGLAIAFARVVLGLTDWGISIGSSPTTEALAMGGALPFWRSVVGFLVHAWIYSYFWSAIPILYLILRRDVDGTPWHDVHLPEHDSDSFAGDLDPQATAKSETVEAAEIA